MFRFLLQVAFIRRLWELRPVHPASRSSARRSDLAGFAYAIARLSTLSMKGACPSCPAPP